MNYRLISRVFGLLLLLLSLGMAACAGFAWFEARRGESAHAMGPLIWSALITVAAGVVLYFVGIRSGRELLRKEAIVVVGLGWFISAAFGMIPYLLAEPRLDLAPAFFESVSGFTTTGSTVITDLDPYPRAILLWRSLTQWFGGVGILVLFVALLSHLGAGGKSLFRVESSARVGEGSEVRIRQTALTLWGVYLLFSIICLLGLRVLGMTWFEAVCHAMTTVATGGFGIYNDSIAHFDSAAIDYFLTVMMLAASISFFVHAAIVRRDWRRLWVRAEGRRFLVEEEGCFFLILAGLATLLIVFNLWVETEVHETLAGSLRASTFQVASIISTTGFATEDFSAWPGFSVAVLLFLMFLGGCSGSTAGGMKIARILLFFKTVRQQVIISFRPRRVLRIELNRRPAESSARSAVFLIALFLCCTFLGTLAIAFLEPTREFDTCFSAAIATLYNIGPGIGKVGPESNFAFFKAPAMMVMSVLMVMGRLELFAVLALFVPSLWKKY